MPLVAEFSLQIKLSKILLYDCDEACLEFGGTVDLSDEELFVIIHSFEMSFDRIPR